MSDGDLAEVKVSRINHWQNGLTEPASLGKLREAPFGGFPVE